MTIAVFFPDGTKQEYENASGLHVQDGLTMFYYQPEANKLETKRRKIITTLQVLADDEELSMSPL
ncbi:MAG TPA: hypothetical protein VI386_24875 [Candidatus Sulfotelmatobacter sp.]